MPNAWSFEAPVAQYNDNLWSVHIPVPEPIVQEILDTIPDRRLVVCLNRTVKFHAALMPFGDGQYFILLNKEKRKQLKVEVGDVLSVQLAPDTSEYGMPMPESLREVMDADPEGDQYFHALTPGKQRSLIHLIGKIKSIDLQITKSLIIMEHLKNQKGKLDHKQLREDFRRG